MRKKYIIFDDIFPCLISDGTGHADMKMLGRIPTSAGFFSTSVNRETGKISVNVFGESIGLKLKSDPEDAYLLERLLNNDW